MVGKNTQQSAMTLRPVARTPSQARGQARVEVILDAAAAVIVEEGLAAVTMHVLAKRAQTSIGSMYHFFPDRDRVLEMLSERHAVAIQKINQQLYDIPADAWRQFSAADAIERLVTPYVTYLLSHADFLPLMHGRVSIERDADFIRTIRHVLDARLHKLEAVEREGYAVMLHAIGAGTMHVGFQTNPVLADMYLREIPRVLTAYLTEIEASCR